MTMNKYNSESILEKNIQNTAQRCIFKSLGYTDFELSGRPLIGVANTYNTICPGSYNLSELAKFVVKGIYSAGGTAAEFGVIGSCDGIVDGDSGGRYTLPGREIICDSIEIQLRTSKLDALVLIGSCDKIVPGLLMAAARLNVPCIFLNGGPMLGGVEFNGKKSDQTTTDEAMGMYSAGRLAEEEIYRLEDLCMPSCGSCSFLGTANTMCCLAEALGMSLPGSALVPAVYSERRRIAFETGRQICYLAEHGISARNIITRQSLTNAVRVCSAISGSTNAQLHLTAIAKEAEIDLNIMDEFSKAYSDVPQIVKVNPAAKWDMEEFYRAGGIPRVMRNLLPLLQSEALTCTGKTVRENVQEYAFQYVDNHQIIRTVDQAYEPNGGICVLRGSLAPDGAVTKPGAFDKSLYRICGPARVFDSEEEANRAILEHQIMDGDVIVIRYEGPKGGPGMREMYRSMKYLYGQGKGTTTALITDGRFSGTNNGCFVGHISPEAAEGGPIALIEDGDEILIDVNSGLLEFHVDGITLEKRKKTLRPIKKEIPNGYLRLYAQLASSAAEGAGLSRI